MEITLEQVEQLRSKADISYTRAKEALSRSGGNLLDALIFLEDSGDIPRPEETRYSTRPSLPSASPPPEPEAAEPGEKPGLLTWLRRILLDNELEIWHRDDPVTALPVLIVILLILFLPLVSIPLLVLGLFFGFRYRFAGPELDREDINEAMFAAADTAAGFSRKIADEVRTHQTQTKTGQQKAKAKTKSEPGQAAGEEEKTANG